MSNDDSSSVVSGVDSNKGINAAGGVVWRKSKKSDEPEFLLLLHKHGKYWAFPKGRSHKGESTIETAKREIIEETGIKNFTFIERFSKNVKYFVRRGRNLIPKEVHYFLVQFSKRAEISLSREHIAYKWLKFDDAISCITHDNSKEILKEVYARLQSSDQDE